MPDTKSQFKDDTLYPVDASMRGDNAHYLDYCESGGMRPGYAVCLNKIKAVEENRMSGMLGACEAAIQQRTCAAFHMRDKERLEGRALFYINRNKLNAHIAELNKLPIQSEFLNELKAAQSKTPTKPASIAKPVTNPTIPAKPIVGAFSYADAINAAISEAASQPPAPVEEFVTALESVAKSEAPQPAILAQIGEPLVSTGSAPALKPEPGESLLEFAKRQRAARATA
jgi:hypothetical protein